MRTLDDARSACETYLPGLAASLAGIPLETLEAPGSPAIGLFRSHGGPALVIPKAYSGLAASPLDAVRVMRALASYSPSLAVASAMHHFSVATLFTLAESIKNSGMEWALLEGIASQGLLVASGFAEGQPGRGILAPAMAGEPAEGGYRVNGAKKPCSLSRSMDLLTASVALGLPDGGSQLAVLLIPAATEGVTVHPFWVSPVLAGAESDEIRLTDVFVHDQLIMRTEPGDAGQLDELQTVGFIWFEMLISSAYLGMASGLVERVFARRRGGAGEVAAMAVRLETAALLLEGVARMLMDGEVDDGALARALMARYGAQDAITDAVRQAVELLGGMAFIGSADVAYLAAACHCLGFHPPSRSSAAQPLADFLGGHVLRIS
ncbi:MAG: acyl-CoA/acyl-ACP dehydrogenase [Actinobacteria bacterium]|nr:acyl-CoA/acyl-ACP dehydrogenase [Actinomycetota bacterium]MBI3688539.1 acyl-CoA/acyl-ACP dehydrogenase [Actinomycetota bacterium]